METETVKIRTNKGRIITLTVSNKTETHYKGTDKYGAPVKIPIEDIDLLLPVTQGDADE